MSKAQEILKAGKFTVHGIEYDVDFAGTNNDPANNILTGDIQRIHGTRPDGYINVPPFNAELIEVTKKPDDKIIVIVGEPSFFECVALAMQGELDKVHDNYFVTPEVMDAIMNYHAPAVPEPDDEPFVAVDYPPGKYDDVTVDPPSETPAPEPTDEAPVVESEPEPAEPTPAPRRARKH